MRSVELGSSARFQYDLATAGGRVDAVERDRRRTCATLLAIALMLVSGCAHHRTGPRAGTATSTIGVARIKSDAQSLGSFVETKLAHAYLDRAQDLPRIQPRIVREPGKEPRTVDEDTYYTPPKYGSVLAYVRPLDLIARALGPGAPETLEGFKVLDYGYGGIGHLRLLALLGAIAIGVDVDPLLPLIYSESSDQGAIGRGRVTILYGRFPQDRAVVAAVGAELDVIISKNTLKNGYVHPPADSKYPPLTGVSDEVFLEAIAQRLKPHGLFMIYNIGPSPESHKPMADIRSPFSRELIEKHGLEIIAFDQEDTGAVRAMAKILAWDTGEEKIDLERDLFAMYTLLRRR